MFVLGYDPLNKVEGVALYLEKPLIALFGASSTRINSRSITRDVN